MNSEILHLAADTPIPIWSGGKPMSLLRTNATAGNFIMKLTGRAQTPPNQKRVDVPIAWNDTANNVVDKILAAVATIGVEGNVEVYGDDVNSNKTLVFIWSAPLDVTIDADTLVATDAYFGHSNIDFGSGAKIGIKGSSDFYVGGPNVTEDNGLPFDGGTGIGNPPPFIDCPSGSMLFAIKGSAFNIRVFGPNYPALLPF